jgi:hypothetical protein
VAVLAPLPDVGALDRLRAAGEVNAAVTEFDDLPEPLQPAPGTPLPSEVLERLRRDAR